MGHWKRGEPKPENWPEWLKEASIDWCDVNVSSSGDVAWFNGIWRSGTWGQGTWQNGFWLDGLWQNGLWKEGTWERGTWLSGAWCHGTWRAGVWGLGTWRDGSWHSGRWEQGIWRNGTWGNGTWKNGVWENGFWKNGTWEDGRWYNGTWEDGTWLKGHQAAPRFGWHYMPSGLICGYIPQSGWLDKTAEEWRALSLSPDRRIELEALLAWSSAKEDIFSPKVVGPSLWEMLD